MSGSQTIGRWTMIAASGALIGLACRCGGATNGLGPVESGDASMTPLEAASGQLDGAGTASVDGAGPRDGAGSLDGSASAFDAAGGTLDSMTEAASDASPDALKLCLTDAPVLNALSATASNPDATDSSCFGCIVATCPTELGACAGDCACNEQVLTFAACTTDGGAPVACALPLANSTDPATAALAACVGGALFGGSATGCLLSCATVGGMDGSTGAH